MDMEFQFCKMKKILEVDGGDGCTTMWMHLMPLNSTCKNSFNGKFYVMYILPQVLKSVSISEPVIHLGMYSKDIIREEGKDVCIRVLT